jgi:predicted transcriptional regulator
VSDLYLVLRSRLDAVPEWVYIETEILRSARESKGLSYETMARTVPVSAKTWERYEKAGRIPRPILSAVADTLGLEIEEPVARRVTLESPEPEPAIRASLDEIRGIVEGIDRKVDVLDLPARLAAIDERLRELTLEIRSRV